MEDLLIKSLTHGFPTVVAAYLLTRIDKDIQGLTLTLKELGMEIAKFAN